MSTSCQQILQQQLIGHPYLQFGVIYILCVLIGITLGFSLGMTAERYIGKWLHRLFSVVRADKGEASK